MNNIISIALFISLSFSCKQTSYEHYTPIEESTFYKVIGVKDGDTFVVLNEGKSQTVRFAHIDCPEKKQPFGQKAKHFVSDKCYGKNVRLVSENKYDRYHRLIAVVILEDGTNLNKELVSNGLAWHFKKYSHDPVYSRLESVAKSNRLGLWSKPNPIPPWKWRNIKKQIKSGIPSNTYTISQ